MRTIKIMLIAMSCFFFFWVSAYAADVAKIGVVDFQRILEASSAGKFAQAEINKKGKKMEEDLKQRGGEIEKIKKRLEREALVMSKEMREEKAREIRININDFKILQKKYTKEFKTYENRIVNRIKKEVLDLVTEIGKSGGYLLVIEKREGGIIYAPNKIDITDKLIQKYNVKFSQKKDADSGKKKK